MCNTDEVVIARAKTARSYMSNDDAAIYTKTNFEVVDVLEDTVGLTAKTPFSIVQEGGEVEIDGKHFGVDHKNMEVYKKDGTYLLWMNASPQKKNLFFPAGPTVEVKNDVLTPRVRKWDLVATGTRVVELKAEMARVANIEECAAPGNK
jgi:hypothetical protein